MYNSYVVINVIDLTQLFTGNINSIDIDSIYNIKDKITDKRILDITDISVKGNVERKNDDYFIKFNASGKILINDSVSFDEIWYPINMEFDENLSDFCDFSKNYLDIIEILCQNIVLEVPLRYTIVKNYDNIKGEGWKLVSEEELLKNNPFSSLLNNEDRSD